MNAYYESLDLNEIEELVKEYDEIKNYLIMLGPKTQYLDYGFLLDVLQDTYAKDIDELKDILNEEENGSIPSDEEDYKENVIVPTIRGLR